MRIPKVMGSLCFGVNPFSCLIFCILRAPFLFVFFMETLSQIKGNPVGMKLITKKRWVTQNINAP